MSRLSRYLASTAMFLVANHVVNLSAQTPGPLARPHLSASSLPAHVSGLAPALGNRLVRPGKERMVITGVLRQGVGEFPLTLIWELPGKFRLEMRDPQPRTIVSDGQQHRVAGGAITDQDQQRMESLVGDTAESFLFQVRGGVGTRLLGRRFRTDDGRRPNYQGPLFDIFVIGGPALVRTDRVPRQKMFYFDSRTGLLQSVRYMILKQGSQVVVQTQFSEWRLVDGQFVPGLIARREGTENVFSYRVMTAAFGPQVSDNTFSVP